MRAHNPIIPEAPDQYTPAQRFAVLVRRNGPGVVATGDRNVRVQGPLTPEVLRRIEAAAHILRVDLDFYKVTAQYIYITLHKRS